MAEPRRRRPARSTRPAEPTSAGAASAGRRDGKEILVVDGREVPISNPDKVLFPEAGITKLDLARYFVSIAPGALRGAGGRPNVLVRYPNGIDGEFFYQKRAPAAQPEWVEVVELKFPSGRTAREVVPRDTASLVWMANLACLEFHPHPVRAEDLDHPDELRVDLDPVPGVEWAQVREVAGVVRETLADFGLVGWPKTSGSRGMHILVRIRPQWEFTQVRRAALALAREVERRAPSLATSKWWKEERHGVFVDYNQNAKDRTVASAYSVRPRPDARVSTPLFWNESPTAIPRISRFEPCRSGSRRSGTRTKASTCTLPPSNRCWSFQPAMSARGSATRPGRRTIVSRPANRPGCSPPGAAHRAGRTTRPAVDDLLLTSNSFITAAMQRKN